MTSIEGKKRGQRLRPPRRRYGRKRWEKGMRKNKKKKETLRKKGVQASLIM